MRTAPAPSRTTSPRTPRPRRSRRLPWIALLLVATVVGVLVWSIAPSRSTSGATYPLIDPHTGYLGTDGWPEAGQGAYRLGDAPPSLSPGQKPAPIASVAKVMTAYVVIQKWPLAAGQEGPSHRVTEADVADTERRRARGESIVAVAAGETLSERQALMAVLLPSANNVAVMLGRWVAGSEAAFVAQMNETAKALHMSQTRYTDPSGYEATTVSTAADQLILAEVVAKDPVLAEIMRTPSYELPYAGTIRNTDMLLGTGGFVGMKTGSHQAAGGCFMFRALRVRADGTAVELVGVVLGQPARPGVDLIMAGQLSALELAERIVPDRRIPEKPVWKSWDERSDESSSITVR